MPLFQMLELALDSIRVGEVTALSFEFPSISNILVVPARTTEI